MTVSDGISPLPKGGGSRLGRLVINPPLCGASEMTFRGKTP